MSRDDLAVAQAALSAWPDTAEVAAESICSDACRRLLDAMAGLAVGQAGWRDVAALIRQVLLTSQTTYGGYRRLSVPVTQHWPTVKQWHDLRCTASALVGGGLSIRALDWEPLSSTDEPAAAGLAREQVRAVYREVEPEGPTLLPADPFWKFAHGYPTYRGESQRQAARAAVLNDGEALVVALPTGRGKTAVAWSKVLLSSHGVTIVIVPTVVLALDMERRTAELARSLSKEFSPNGRYAYVGSLDNDTKKELRDQVRSGQQRLLYTSPEAFVSGLAGAVLECARAGHVQQIVIDEAHLVDQWGANFRPEFQTMPGLIREAHDSAPEGSKPAVLLLSATLSQQPLRLLTKLFAVGGDEVELIWGSELRTEPAYFLDSYPDEQRRAEAIVTAVSCLPRPLLLYATKVNDAQTWAATLRANGLLRVGCVTGDSSDEQRRNVMEQWRGLTTAGQPTTTGLDVVVGTSAFGLGLDMPNVRTVLHACLPETVDRYYQEVGRAGRDGRPSIAYLCRGPGDEQIAESLSRVVLIGDDLGWKRWQSMMHGADHLTGFRYRVRKSTLPTYLTDGYGRSAQWNVRTLTLMAQAGVIGLRAPQWTPDPDASEEANAKDRDDFYANVDDFLEFELVNGELLGEHGWKTALAAIRHDVSAAQHQALHAVLSLVQGQECVGRVIAQHFQVSFGGGTLRTSAACRGCPSCRRAPERSPGTHPLDAAPDLPAPRRVDPLAAWRGDRPGLFIWYAEGQQADPLLLRLAQRGVHIFAGLTESAADHLQRSVPNTPIVTDGLRSPHRLSDYYPGPIAFVLPQAYLQAEAHERLALGLISYIIGEDSTPDPGKPGNLLRDVTGATTPVSLGALLRSL
jgi:ATP-dependent DNA helicase RecQ